MVDVANFNSELIAPIDLLLLGHNASLSVLSVVLLAR